ARGAIFALAKIARGNCGGWSRFCKAKSLLAHASWKSRDSHRVLPAYSNLPECRAIACNRGSGLLAFRDFPGCRNKAKLRKITQFP
ncbi:MAG: hypothetical protein LBT33_05070, partial [Spirochaetia bacterium]|nr:hypothetical protein [Spirochaetia bacterium]